MSDAAPVWGTPLAKNARKVLLLGSGELGKEVVIELQRLGIEVVAVDRYPNAPAMQVAHRSHVIDMTDAAELRRVVLHESPELIVPEIEAIATPELLKLEQEGFTVIPTARATRLTMDREGIRKLAAEELGLATSPYRFASSLDEVRAAIDDIGLPCVVKPTMSSSGHGQSVVRDVADVEAAWGEATTGSRARTGRVIVEGFVKFDYEITLLTVRHANGTSFCPPVGHLQIDGDYHESWQPQPMTDAALRRAHEIAGQMTGALGGRGIFGVELFVRGDEVLFSEVSPRPHDTGLVTMATQNMSEFELHARAILGLPVPEIRLVSPGASAVILAHERTDMPTYTGVPDALREPDVWVRVFGKPNAPGHRRMGVVVVRDADIASARAKARSAADRVSVR